MNILMVGHSGAGKTSFMAGMYKDLGDSSKKSDYGIRAKNWRQKESLERMAKDLAAGKYPAGTDVQEKYEFSFVYKGDELIPFTWIDYRGGILLSDSPDDENEMNQFKEAIKGADALIVFLDGQKLSQRFKGREEYLILMSCIEQSLSVSHSSWLPISFVVTKCDICDKTKLNEGLTFFKNLFSQIHISENVHGMLVFSSITSKSYNIPFKVLAFSIYGGTPICKKRFEYEKEEARRQERIHRPTSILGKVFGVAEQILKEITVLVYEDAKWKWDTEYEKTWRAERTFSRREEDLRKLSVCAAELKKQLYAWSREDIVKFL